jgi:aldose 1-epimerase
MSRINFGVTADGFDVDMIELRNKNGLVVKCIPYGCRITHILLPSQKGPADIVLGFDKISGYEADNTGQGAFIGRYANRIKGASAKIGGRDYPLMKNDGSNYLHGVLQNRVFDVEEANDKSVKFKIVSKDGEEGFPGELEITVIYSLSDDNRFTMDYFARTSADTHINLTNHAYFDLSCGFDQTIEKHLLRIESDAFLETTEDLIPSGKKINVDGTPLDFRKKKPIGRDIGADDINLKFGRGYDHCFLLKQGKPGELSLAAEASCPEDELSMKIFTTQPAIQFYTGNFLDGTLNGKGRAFNHRAAFCIETQHYPDTPHHPDFPPTLLRPGEEFHETTVLEFSF